MGWVARSEAARRRRASAAVRGGSGAAQNGAGASGGESDVEMTAEVVASADERDEVAGTDKSVGVASTSSSAAARVVGVSVTRAASS